MAGNIYNNIKVSGISVVIPDYAQTSNNQDCNQFFSSPKGVSNVDMCESAANDLIKNLIIDTNSLDAVIFIHQYPDHLSPSSSHIIHKRFNLPATCSVFDIYHGGSGYVYGLWVAGSMLSTGFYKKIMLLAGEHINEQNTNFELDLCLSSAGSATLLEYDTNASPSFFNIITDSSKYEDIIIPAGAYRLPVTHEILDEKIKDKAGHEWSLMQKIYNKPSFEQFIYDNVPECVKDVLSLSGSSVDNIDFFAFNQFNKKVVNHLAEKLNIPNDKYSAETFTKYGNNTVISSLVNLLDCMKNKLIESNNKICFISYGEGLSCASAIIDISKIYCSNILKVDFQNCIMPEDYTSYWIERIKNSK